MLRCYDAMMVSRHRSPFRTVFLLTVGLMLGYSAPSSTDSVPDTRPQLDDTEQSYVVLVSIDGFAAYHLENERLELPNIRALVNEGVWAESGKTVFPSVTHPSHATIITGVSPRRHGVINNLMRNRETGESGHVSEQSHEVLEVPTLFDAAKRKGLTTAAMFWPETRGDPSVDFNIIHEHQPPSYDDRGELDPIIARPELLAELRAGDVPIDLYFQWYGELERLGAREMILAQATSHLIRTHRPQLVATLISLTDSFQHTYGPAHYLAEAALTKADYCVGMLRKAVRDAGIEDKTTFVITADHGFHTVTHEVNLHPLLSRSELEGKVTLHADAWTTYIELTDAFQEDRDQPRLETLLRLALRLDGISRIVRPEAFHALGTRSYSDDPRVPGQYMILADIDTFLVSEPSGSSTVRQRLGKPQHAHGYLPDHPRMYPAFVISGHKVRRGERIGRIRNHDIAPTIAHLLGLEMKNVEGRVLTEALSK